MPVATIGLFGLAIVIIALAFGIQQLVGGDDDDETSSEDSAVETAEALNKTSTAQAGDQPTQPPAQTQQPNGTRTPGASVTPGTGTPSSGGGTYTVRPGDTCGSIAADHDITLDELLEANDMTEDDCTTLQIGQVLEIPS
jgi:LysM repeat protein